MTFPIYNYPTKAKTDPNIIYQGLGSFWTQIFQEKSTVKGLTQAQTEELIQRYYDLLETVSSFAVDTAPVYHTEKWLPFVIYKSKFNKAPFLFKQDDVLFGKQPNTGGYFDGVTFQFGKAKVPVVDVYVYDIANQFTDAPVITNRIFNPSVLWTKEIDYTISDDVVYFNKNIFDLPQIASTKVINELGEPQQYKDAAGNLVDEELVVLWVCHAKVDENILYKSFGYVFSFNQTNDEFFKAMLKAMFSLSTDGPTVHNVKAACAAFMQVPIVIEKGEIVEKFITTSANKLIVTNVNVYKYDAYYNVIPSLHVGSVVNSGDVLVDALAYHDNGTTPNWWNYQLSDIPYVAISKYLFLGNYDYQLFFKPSIELVSLNSAGNIVFPVKGSDSDVKLFNAAMNTTRIKTSLGLTNPGDVAVMNPVDFLFRNFFGTNAALLKFKFKNTDQIAHFASLLSFVTRLIPKHIYLVYDITLNEDVDSYESLNGATPIVFDSGTQILNADGSNSIGTIESLAPYNYRDVTNRLFAVAHSPNPPLRDAVVKLDGALIDIDDDGAAITNIGVVAQLAPTPLKVIPTGATTATYSNLLLLNFT